MCIRDSMGQANAAQFIQPFINSGVSAANAQQGNLSSIYNQSLNTTGQLAGNVMSGNTALSGNALSGNVGGLNSMLNTGTQAANTQAGVCLLYTSDAADERSSVDLGG